MKRATAVMAFTNLESSRYLFEDENFPRFDVRLDAEIDNNDERAYRLFVRRGSGAPTADSEDDWRYLLDQAKEYGLLIRIENNGIELT